MDYARGLGTELRKKSMMALARSVRPDNVEGCRQVMQRAVASSRFDASSIFARVSKTISHLGPGQLQALCVDDTGIAKQGSSSVGVQRQYSGTLGKIGNCQIVTTLHGVSNTESFCLGGRLYLPESWASDEKRREKAQVPKDVAFLSKPQIALDLIREALSNGIPKRIVLADAAFGDSRDFRDGLESMELDFAVATSPRTLVWAEKLPDKIEGLLNPKKKRPPLQHGALKGRSPISVLEIAEAMEASRAFRNTTWRQGTKEPLKAPFARIRVRGAERYRQGLSPSKEMWLVVEKTGFKKRPFKFYFSSLDMKMPMRELVKFIKMRWRIEMDYRDMKQHLGLDQYEGRTWGGFHRHLAMVMLMQVFIALYKERFSPRS